MHTVSNAFRRFPSPRLRTNITGVYLITNKSPMPFGVFLPPVMVMALLS